MNLQYENYEASIEEHSFTDLGGDVLSNIQSIIYYKVTSTGEKHEVLASEVPEEVVLHFERAAAKFSDGKR